MLELKSMTTDPPLAAVGYEDVRIGSWESRLPTSICTNKEIFEEIFSVDTWKSVFTADQRERVLKMLPPEVLKVPGAAEETIEALFSKSLTNFGVNPLDTFFDKLENGHYDPEVVETKTNIVREWKRESLRLRKQYHTKLLQDIVVSREKHLRKLLPVPKKNGRKSLSSSNNCNTSTAKKNGKPPPATSISNGTSNGIGSGGATTKGKNQKNENHPAPPGVVPTTNNGNKGTGKTGENKSKRSREPSLTTPSQGKEEGPAKKKAKQQNTPTPKSKGSKKAKDIVIVTSQQLQSGNNSSTSLILGNSSTPPGGGTPSQQKSVLLGTLSTNALNETPSLSIRSPPVSSATSSLPPPPTSLLESLTAPINPAVISTESSSLKQFQKIFPLPSGNLLSVSSSSSSSTQTPFLPSPVQSSPILASQLQAPSPISVNLSTITNIRGGSGTGSPTASQSSITLNYTQAPPQPLPPPPSATVTTQQHQSKGLIDDDSSSDEFEFETIEPTIGFGGSTIKSTPTVPAPYKTLAAGGGNKKIPTSTPPSQQQQLTTISSHQLASLQKCSLLSNCLTQPLVNASSASATAALANNILTSSTSPLAAQVVTTQQLLQSQPKFIVTSSGAVATQLHKYISAPPPGSPSTVVTTSQQKLVGQQQHQVLSTSSATGGGGLFQQKNVISVANMGSVVTSSDAQSLVNTIMASSKDLLATFGAPLSASTPQHNAPSSILPISVNLQQGQGQLKPTYIRAPTGLLQSTSALLPSTPSVQQQLLSLPQAGGGQQIVQQRSTLNTQSLTLPSSILSKSTSSPTSIPNLLDSDDLGLNLGSFSMGLGMNLDMGMSDIDGGGSVVDNIKLELDCGMDKIDDLSVLDGNPFDSIPNLSDELDGLDLDMVDGLCDFEVLLSEEKQYPSFFSLIREVLCSTRDHRMTLVCLEKTIKKWSLSPGATLNPWYMRVADWNSGLIVALNFLAGNYQDVHPEDFVPYIEYKYKTKYYQWIGAGRDGDNNLGPLCSLWMDNLDKLPPLKKAEGEGEEPEEEEDENEDSDATVGGEDIKKKNKRPQTPPPPRCTTDWTVRPSTGDEKDDFRAQEKCRFDNPHKAFTYRMHNYESVVGPVKGVYSSQTGITNKARGHSLLVDDRPPYVTILALVRDAVARLPNGEGTRSEICEMLRDSAFLAPEASNVTLNSVVSGALDRLHYERDPCVRYDSHKKSWIYLHRDRTQEQFERLHHNRSYTKSTKSRNSSSRKGKKGSSKGQAQSGSSNAASTSTTTMLSSSSSSQSSFSAASSVETTPVSTTAPPQPGSVAAVVSVGATSGGSTLALPSTLSTVTPKVQSIVNSNKQQQQTLTGLVTGAQQQQQLPSSGIQVQSSLGIPQASPLSSIIHGGREDKGIVVASLQDPSQQQQQPSLNEVLAAAAGLRFQTVQPTTSPVANNNTAVVFGQGKAVLQQDAISSQQSTRLLLHSGPPPATPPVQISTQQTSHQPQQQPTTQTVQVQIPANSVGATNLQTATTSFVNAPLGQGGQTTAAAIAPGQFLLGSSAVLKLAGNIRLGEGLRLTQLRLPGTTTAGTMAAATAPLRLPQHRILLARGALPGQSQAQGVLLGQTSTGQTVILSAANPAAGALGSLHQALNGGGGMPAQLGQIALHGSGLETMTAALQQSQAGLQQSQQIVSVSSAQQSMTFTTSPTASAVPPKFGIITNVPLPANSTTTSPPSASSALSVQAAQSQFTTGGARVMATQQQISSATTSLPASATTISLPASMLQSAQLPLTQQTPPQNITVATGHAPQTPQQQQQQLNLSAVVSGLSNSASQSAQIASLQAVGVPAPAVQQVQLQAVQQQSLTQGGGGLMAQLQSQTSTVQHGQNSAAQQASHQLAAPIIIRSAQGDFVSFGIPSHMTLGRGVQGIKVIPFQAGKQTVLARIVAPGTTTTTATAVSSANPTVSSPSNVLTGSLTNSPLVSSAGIPLSVNATTVVTSTPVNPVATTTSAVVNTQSSNNNAAF